MPGYSKVRYTRGASVSPDGTAFAHIVDDGDGYPRAVQRFLYRTTAARGKIPSSERPVELPTSGPVTRVIHSADGHWLALEVAPDAGERHQVWVVTTDPEDRAARRIGNSGESMMELVNWDGNRVVVVATHDDGVSEGQLIDPETQEVEIVDSRVGGFLTDSWNGSALLRVGPRGYRELLLIHGSQLRPILPSDAGSVTDMGFILDTSHATPPIYTGRHARHVNMLVRSNFQSEMHRLLAIEIGANGARHRVLAQREDADLDEFCVADNLSIVALLWNRKGISELQILNLADGSLGRTIELPGTVAHEISMSATGSLLAVTVQSPTLPPSVELVDPFTGQWHLLESDERTTVDTVEPHLCEFNARDGMPLSGWFYPADSARSDQSPSIPPVLMWFHGGPESQSRPEYNGIIASIVAAGIAVFAPNVRGSGGFGRSFEHADDRYGRYAGIDDAADCAFFLVSEGLADAGRIAVSGRSYGGYLTLAALTFHPDLFAAGIAVCGMSDLESFYANTEPWIAAAAYTKYGHPVHDRELLKDLSPIHRIDDLVAPLLVVHGRHDTNVPFSESVKMVDAVRARGGIADLLAFDDEGHDIVQRENKIAMADAMVSFVRRHVDA